MSRDQIPKDVLGPRPETPKEFEKQQERIEKWLVERAADDAAEKLNPKK